MKKYKLRFDLPSRQMACNIDWILQQTCLLGKDTSYNSIFVIIDRLTLEEFINGFHDGIFTEKALVLI